MALYFAFPDGVYDYVCAECTALCCKGHGFAGSLKRELRSLFVLYPQMESMALSRIGDQVTFSNAPESCEFLDADNLCRIEKEHDRSLKPTVCQLFPFNGFSRIGDTIAVTPHFLCPLRLILPARPGHVQGTHALLETTLRDMEVFSKDFVRTSTQQIPLHATLEPNATIEREKQFRDLCSGALGQESFNNVLRSAAAEPSELDDFFTRVARVMRIEVPARSQPRDEVDDFLLAITPVHRLSLLSLSSEAILRALVVMELIVRRTWTLSTQPLNLQSAMQMASRFAAAQRLMGRGDEPLNRAIKSSKKDLSFEDAGLTFAAYIFQKEVGAGTGVLTALEKAIPPEMSVSDRSVLFQRMGSLIDRTPANKRLKKERVVSA